jgi:hypothetical protein
MVAAMNRRHDDHLPSRRIARALERFRDWLTRDDNDVYVFVCIAGVFGIAMYALGKGLWS